VTLSPGTRLGYYEVTAKLPDGRSFLFPDFNRLLVLPIAGGRPRELLHVAPGHSIQRPSLSADGRWLTCLDIADESDVWLAELDGGEPGDR
jgi:hypothetical protein